MFQHADGSPRVELLLVSFLPHLHFFWRKFLPFVAFLTEAPNSSSRMDANVLCEK